MPDRRASSPAGRYQTPGSVTINGFPTSNFGNAYAGAILTLTFWRSMQNMAFNVSTASAQNAAPNTLQWGASQGTSLRRIQLHGNLELTDS